MDPVYEKEILPIKEDFNFNSEPEDICETMTFGDALSEAIFSPHFSLFWAYFSINVVCLLCHLLCKWKYLRTKGISYYKPSFIKYGGRLIGVFSVVISGKVIFSEESCPSEVYLTLFSFVLSAIAVLCEFDNKSSVLFSVCIMLISTGIIIASVKNYFKSEDGKVFNAQFLYGVLHLALGIELFVYDKMKEKQK